MKDSIPYSQFLRVRRICSKLTDYDINCQMLRAHFIRREYPPDLVDDAIRDARLLDRTKLLQEKTHKDNEEAENRHFFITTFQPEFPEVKQLIKKNWKLLAVSNTTKKLHEGKIVFGYRRCLNLRDSLVRAELPPLEEKDNKSNPICSIPAQQKNANTAFN